MQLDDPDIRCATPVAIGYVEWKELGPIVQRVKASDSDPSVRKFARVTSKASKSLEESSRHNSILDHKAGSIGQVWQLDCRRQPQGL